MRGLVRPAVRDLSSLREMFLKGAQGGAEAGA